MYRCAAPGAPAETLTSTDDRLVPEHWTRYGLVVRGDRGGNEIWQLSLLTPDGGLRPLTHDARAIHGPARMRADGRSLGLSWNPDGQQDMVLGELALPGGDLHPWLTPTGFWNWLAWSPEGDRAVVSQSFGSWAHTYLLDREARLTPVLEQARIIEAAEWTPSGLFLITDGGNDFLGVAEVDPERPARVRRWLLEENHDVLALRATPDGRRAAVVVNGGLYDEIRVIDLSTGTAVERVQSAPGIVLSDHAGNAGRHIAWSVDGRTLFVAWDEPDRPADIVAHPGGHRWTGVNTNPPAGLVMPSATSYPSFDGLRIPAIEYRIDEQPRATVCLFHGGPEGQWRGGYAPLHHLLNAIGLNTFGPNVRGSTGYGFRFQSLDDKTLRWDSVKDGCEAGRWLRRTGRATRIAAMGGSYGGFMTLAVLVEAPELWDASVDTVGIARWRSFFERMPPWRGVLRIREYGDPFGEDAEFLESISPLHRAATIRTPLLVVHGRNDPRVPVAESEAIAARAERTELLIFENEGHGIARHENQERYHRRILEFLQAHLQPLR